MSATENWIHSIDAIDGDADDDGAADAIVTIGLADFARTQYPKINLNSPRNLESIVVDGATVVAAGAAVDAADARVTMTKGQMKELN